MYKVLEVREYESNLSNTYMPRNHFFVVICTNEKTKQRERFIFYEGYISTFLDKENYYGYSGDFNLLVKGDKFEIIQTDTYRQINIVDIVV